MMAVGACGEGECECAESLAGPREFDPARFVARLTKKKENLRQLKLPVLPHTYIGCVTRKLSLAAIYAAVKSLCLCAKYIRMYVCSCVRIGVN